MAVLLFPGQGSQYEGMAKDLYDSDDIAKKWVDKADDILGYSLSDVMFNGSADDLKQTKITQPAVFLNAIIRYYINEKDITPDAVAGHSLGELTALVACGVLKFEDGISLVQKRALAMQEACNNTNGTMAAVLGLEDGVVEDICREIGDIVVAANYNCPGQLVISGKLDKVEAATVLAKEKGAKRAIVLNVNGAFHSPLMEEAQEELSKAIEATTFHEAACPIYQNVNATATKDLDIIQSNLIKQLTSPVRWTQTMHNMITDGHKTYVEFGAKVLSGFFRRVDRTLDISQL
jgi:[acyl-carrier-protein] S-malonyltransferase